MGCGSSQTVELGRNVAALFIGKTLSLRSIKNAL